MSENPSPHDFTPPEIDEISALLPAYEVLSFIAKGGMGAVYLARQKSLEREVAIKILPRHFGEDADFRTSFETEAKSMAKLNHPNLIGIYDFGQVDGLLYIIMEMVNGKSLYHSAYGKQIDPQESARIVAAICRGLASAHQHGILHRDIKPANILLDPKANPKIGDFGLARPAGEIEEGVTFGTPGYAAPEVIHNPSAVDESTDIYAVGVILYELLTGKIPDKAYVPAASLAGCSTKFDAIIRKAIHPTPAMRFRDADEMAEALEPLIKGATAATSPLLQVSRSGRSSGGTPTLVTSGGGSNASKLQTSGGGPDSAPISTPTLSSSKSSSVSFIRNIVIIVALLAGIYIAWEAYQKTAAKRAEDNERITKENEEAKKKAYQKKPQPPKNTTQQKPPKVNPPTPPVIRQETPREQLANLRNELRRGNRVRFPKGTHKLDNRAWFYIEEKMSWHEALKFCEQHGGQLACINGAKDSAWIENNIPRDQPVWLGAGTAGDGVWTWINGSPWTQKIRNTSKAAYVTINHTGFLDPQPASNKNTFFIEWMNDGKLPGSLRNQLRRTGVSAASPTPKYPAGTVTYDGRHFLIVHRNGTWADARELADLAGGTLAVASHPDENQWMLSFIGKHMPKGETCWIGGYRKDSDWKWITGEPWKFASWDTDCPDDTDSSSVAIAVTSNQKWDDFPTNEEAACFLIEWSSDSSGHTPNKDTPKGKVTDADITPIKARCAELILKIKAKYDKLFTSNIKSYEMELSAYKRGLKKEQQDALAPGLLVMQSSYVNGRIPDDFPRDNMPGKVVSILDFRLAKQKDIESDYLDEIESLREKYRETLTKKSNELKTKGLTSLQRKVQDELDAALVKRQEFINYMLGIEEPDPIDDNDKEDKVDGDKDDNDEEDKDANTRRDPFAPPGGDDDDDKDKKKDRQDRRRNKD